MYVTGNWYEIHLPYGKKYFARYVQEWFYFSDGSRKLVKDITPYAVEIIGIEEPENNLSILDFLDDEDEV